ncbi:MFS general substrate transporter [Cutaneotrichosporon oleaginosum]|uniref:MFS general substrate transporter n=1 Tax=Cutaneotrichosporon oleaginosum TaxID=879819 RepID=A0A0J0XQS4_9TREE|nr:MFS general substrate transporter [Cutaneotrichosporon oleaginosum]KLT43441.1 MFS general substrate transporter [Cutaneotrichosporon oleaginosum]TXT05346.1 hypothetical protein COLE_06666 [Cutaneotrichosporon oleaginosum]
MREELPEPDKEAFRRAMFKLDCLFLPAVTLIYFLSFLDRANIGNAKAAGLMQDLKLTNHQYSIALTVTYVPYIAAELPLTLLIRKVGPHILMPALMLAWGIVTTFQGFVHNYAGLLACRFFLGAAEGAVLPCCITYLSSFYTRTRLGKRTAIFFSATSLAGAFSGLLAAGIVNMDGLGGKRGWAWIFIIEGLITVVYAFACFWILPRDPSDVGYLSPEERQAVLQALDIDRPPAEVHEKLTARSVIGILGAPQMWLVCGALFCSGTALFSMAYFSPSIVQGLGHKGIMTQLYSVPPYVCSTALSLIVCFYSDRWHLRGPFIIFSACLSLIGYALYLGSRNPKVRYASLFFQVMGAYVSAPLTSTWMPNNLAPFYRRVTGIVCGFIITNCGGILSTWLFPTTEAPHYKRGTSILLGLCVGMGLFAAANIVYLAWQNRKRAAVGGFEKGGPEIDDQAELGDKSVHFRFIL